MLIVHLFVSYAHVIFVTFSLPPGVGDWLRLLLMALPGLFYLPFFSIKPESFSHCCELILINGFRFNEKYLIGKRVPEQKPHEMTSQNCNLISYSTYVASNFIMRSIKNIQRKVLCLIFSKIFLNLTITIY